MSGKNLLAMGIVVVLALSGLWFLVSDEPVSPSPLRGGGFGPQISGGSVVNSSSSLTSATGGTILWTNASSTGDWFRIVNQGSLRVWCALGTTTSSVFSQGGQLLVPASTSTGANYWEMWGARGAVACASDGTNTITWSFTRQ